MEMTGGDHLLDSITAVPAAAWDELAGPADVDLRHTYLRFREHLEPGAPTVLTHCDRGGLVAALHGCATTGSTALFSHPWKLLTSDQMLRGESREEESQRRLYRGELVSAVVGRSGQAPDWHRLSEAVGQVYVVRAYDSSEVLVHRRTDGDDAVERLIARAQRLATAGPIGAVAFPYVRPGDLRLRKLLERAGFRSATLTAASEIVINDSASLPEFLATLTKRHRYRYRSALRAFDKSGHVAGELLLSEHIDSVVRMELQTMAKHGSSSDPNRLRNARRFLADHASALVRVPAVSDGNGPFACGVHLVGEHSYLTLTFGSSYRLQLEDSGEAYHRVTYHDPVSYCCEHGLNRVRLGLEGFHAKTLRGAILQPRETWYWVPDPRRLESLGKVFDFVGECTTGYLERYASTYR